MTARPRVGVIGVGTHGRRYAAHIQRDVPGLELVGVHRRDAGAAAEVARELGVRAFETSGALIDVVDAVVIVTPPSSHAPLVLQALEADRHVLVEKPVTRTAAEADALIAADDARGGRTMVAHTLRYDPVIVGVRDRLPDVRPVHHVRLAQRLSQTGLAWQRDAELSGGGSIILTGVHLFDSARWILGEEIEIVYAQMRRIQNPVTEDFFIAVAESTSGVRLTMEVSKYTPHRACLVEVVGERGQLFGDYQRHALSVGTADGRVPVDAIHGEPTVRHALEGFRRFVTGEAPNPIPLREGVRAVALADRCYQLARG